MRQRRPHHSQEAPGGSRSTRHARNWAGSRLLALVGVMVAALFAPIGNAAGAQPAAGTVAAGVQLKAPQRLPDFGPNVTIFDPSMPTSEIQATFDAIWEQAAQQRDGQRDRYGLLLPAGRRTAPTLSRCRSRSGTTPRSPVWAPRRATCRSTARSRSTTAASTRTALRPTTTSNPPNAVLRAEQLLAHHVQPHHQRQQRRPGRLRAGNNFWAVSQAVSMRRVDVTGGDLTLMDYCSGPSFASGGYHRRLEGGDRDQRIAAAVVSPATARSIEWSNAVWNQVFSGVVGAPADDTYPDPPYTTLDKTPLSREKPYLFVDDKGGTRSGSRRRASQHERHHLGRRTDAGPNHPDQRTSSSPSRATRSR